MSDASDRSIPATPQRRKAAEEAGMLPKASLLAWCVSAAVVIALLPAWSRTVGSSAVSFFREVIPAACHPSPSLGPIFPWGLVVPSVGILAAAAAAALAVRTVFERIRFAPSRVLPKASRIGPLGGFSRIAAGFGPGRLVDASLSLAALLAAVLVAATNLAPRLAAFELGEPSASLLAAWESLWTVLAAAGAVAAVRFAVARWGFERRIRMTPEEYKESMRSLQADPRVQWRRDELRRSRPRAARAPDTRSDR